MDQEKWSLTDHICRECFGRVLVKDNRKVNYRRYYNSTQLSLFLDDLRPKKEDVVDKVFRCADCGKKVASDDHKDICCCGFSLKDGTDLGIRCVHSDLSVIELCKTEIVAKQVDGGKS